MTFNALATQTPIVAAVRPLLEVENLSIRFPASEPVRNLGFTVHDGETLALVGESGSGKSLSALALMGLLPRAARIASGSVRFQGADLLGRSARDWRAIRGRDIAMVFQ